ncbi:VCBS repeat-containing protein [Archangium lipolyticum]|uniref:VCBS repeat-containing protein n=1 Tax=Archangium lipolyticum TaxID=2970465 RepID=UPI00214A17C7|nr:VCBS repeat-containing protein [Archangium lipolyticum]
MRRTGWQWLLAVCALWTAGCTCGKPPVESALTVAFERPVDGQRLALGDDADVGTAGFQYDVVAVAADSAGREVTLARAKLEVLSAGESVWREGPAATLEGQRVRFPTVTLPGRTNVLRVTVEEEGSKRTASHDQSVTVGSETRTLDIVIPAEGQVLREVDDADPLLPGYQVDFEVWGTGLRGASGLLSCAGVCGIAPVPFTVGDNGRAMARVTLSEPVREAQPSQCVAVVKLPGGDVTSPARGMTLDTEGPRLAISSPVSAVATRTFKVEAVVRPVEDGATATLTRAGAEPLSATVRAGQVFFPEVTVPGDGRHDFQLSVTDSGGNVAGKPFSVVVASTAPTPVLRVPATIGTFVAGQPAQVEAVVKVDDQPVGTEVELWTTVSGRLGQPQRARTVDGSGEGRVARFTLSLAEGANTVKACVRNAAGTQVCTLATTQVRTGRPNCRIVEPSPGDVLPAGGKPVVVRVEALGNNGPVSLSAQRPGASENASGTASGGAASLSMNLSGDGAWSLVASCAGGGVSQAVTVSRDTTPPTLAVTVRDAPGGRIEPSFIDTSPLPGTQVVLDAVTEPFAQVLVQGCGLQGTLLANADEQGRASLRDVGVPTSGTCSFSARAVDLAGNESSVSVPVASAFGTSSLKFESPDPSRTLGPTDGSPVGDGNLQVSLNLGFSAGALGQLKLYRDTAEVGGVPVEVVDTGKTFSGVQLADGVNVLRAVLVNNAGAGACASALYTVDTTPGDIVLTAPGASSNYNLQSDRDPLTPGIQHPLAYTLNGASASATVDVCTSVALTTAAAPCRDGSGWFTLAAGVPAYTNLFSYPDGRYSLKVVLDEGGTVRESAPVSLVVDSVRPEVTALELVGDVNGDRMVNATEWPTGAPVLRVSTSGLATGLPIQVRDATNNTLYGNAMSTGTVTDVTLGSLPSLEEADYSLVVVVTDSAGNANRTVAAVPPNPLDPVNAAALLSFRLDRVVPELSPTSPGRATLGPADDAVPATAGFQLRASALTSADVGPGGVSLRLDPAGTVVTKTPEGRSVSHDFTVEAAGTRSYTLVFTAQDKAGNVSPPVNMPVTVDLEAPRLTLSSPTSGTTLGSPLATVRVEVEGGEGLIVSVFSVRGNSKELVGSFPVVNGVAQGSVNLPEGTQDVTVETVDAAGNRGSASAQGVTVPHVGCDVTLTSPAGTPVTFNQTDDGNASLSGLQYTLHGRTNRCAGQTVSLYKGGTLLGSTVAAPGTGDFSFDVSLPDGEQSRLTVEMIDSASSQTSDFVDYTVDISPPAFSTVTPAQKTLTFVSASNVNLPGTGYVQDLTPGGDAEAELRATVTGATGGRLRILYKGTTELASLPISQSPESLTIPLVLPHGTSGPLELRLRDTALNETVYAIDVTVDVRPPAQVAFTAKVPTGGARKAWVDLTWPQSGDDDATGTPAGYDLRWTTDTLLPTGIPDEATYYGSKVRRETGALLPAQTTSYRLTLPPLAKYFIEVRALDEVGNVSPFRTIPVFDNAPNKVLTNPTARSGFFGLVLASGDLNGDGRDELVAGDSRAAYVVGSATTTNVGAVHIYSDALSGNETPLTLWPSTPTVGAQLFGNEVAVGNVGDASGEGRPDLLVGSPNWSTARGRAFLYFGRTGQPVDPAPIEFRGQASSTNFGHAARIIADLNGDGLSEVLLSADGENGGKGRVYLFFGRTRANWVAASTGNESGVTFVPVDKADRIIEGDTSLNVGTNTYFGRRRGQANVGDLDGDGKPELSISSPYDKVNTLYIYPGSILMARNGATVAERTLTVADTLQRLTYGPVSTGGLNGFGVDVVARVNFTGGPARDLVVSQPESNTLRLFPDGGASGFVQPEWSVTVANDPSITVKRFFGYTLASADINQDGLPDLVTGESMTTSASAWILYNRGGTGAPFDLVAGEGVAQSRFKGVKALGAGVVTGDFNGDGAPDVAAGDPFDTPGRITVWY